jgi:acyl carrier protein phosphodiesterase
LNWLAHVLLSKDDVEFRLGNLLADLVKRQDRARMPPNFLLGVVRHQQIDSFTDTHPVVFRSKSRLHSVFGHASGIVVDIFYDHFLARDWDRYCLEPLAEFTARFYAGIPSVSLDLPDEAQHAVTRMIQLDRLGSYRELSGIEDAMRLVGQRLHHRTGQDFGLPTGVSELVRYFDDLHDDFTEFFPQLQERCGS